MVLIRPSCRKRGIVEVAAGSLASIKIVSLRPHSRDAMRHSLFDVLIHTILLEEEDAMMQQFLLNRWICDFGALKRYCVELLGNIRNPVTIIRK